MVEISLHLLDLIQNSIEAGARTVHVTVIEKPDSPVITVTVTDDGKGMPPEMVASVTDPFITSRKTRRVGLGIPLMKQAAEAAGGGLTIESLVGKGTRVATWMLKDSIDMPPLGDLAGTMAVAAGMNPEIRFVYRHQGRTEFVFDTKQVSEALGGVPLSEPEVIRWMREYLKQNIRDARGGEAF